jgi:hypothetical protein
MKNVVPFLTAVLTVLLVGPVAVSENPSDAAPRAEESGAEAVGGIYDVVTLRVDKVVIDGNMWVNLEESEKWTYLFGFEDGARDIAMHYVPEPETRDIIYEGLPTSLVGEGSVKHLIAEIDAFYQDRKNMMIPVNSALLVVRNRSMGVDEDKIEKYVNYLRGREKDK